MTVSAKSGPFGAVLRLLQAMVHTQAASGILLLGSAVVALAWANLHPDSYRASFEFPLTLGAGASAAQFTFRELINDGLMTIFFFVVGMEIKRELVVGELNSLGKATLPALAAVGGMLLPAGIFVAFNAGGPGSAGWGIPMATDIAFCVGILSLLKSRVPHALVIFVTALAIFDDIGGILVIALFYGHGLNVPWSFAAIALVLGLLWMNRAGFVSALAYGLVGAALWYALHHAGIHATIAGVVLGLMIPATTRRTPERLEDLRAPVQRFVAALHPFVAFLIMPLFALANSGVSLENASIGVLSEPVTLGTAGGLFVGKQVGIYAATLLGVKLGIAPIPGSASLMKVFGVSVIAGVGFTVALFIAALAYPSAPDLLDQAKIGILVGSLAAGLCGFVVLRLTPKLV